MAGNTCVGCETRPTRCRTVVDLDTGRAVGVVCRACLTAAFGDTVSRPEWRRDDGCAVCERDAFYGLAPASRGSPRRDAGFAASRDECAADDRTVGLCDEHLAWLTGDEPVAGPAVATGGD